MLLYFLFRYRSLAYHSSYIPCPRYASPATLRSAIATAMRRETTPPGSRPGRGRPCRPLVRLVSRGRHRSTPRRPYSSLPSTRALDRTRCGTLHRGRPFASAPAPFPHLFVFPRVSSFPSGYCRLFVRLVFSLACRPPALSLCFCLSNIVYSRTQSTVQASTQEPLYPFCANAGTPVVRPRSPLCCV
jgi:hypothetical protein